MTEGEKEEKGFKVLNPYRGRYRTGDPPNRPYEKMIKQVRLLENIDRQNKGVFIRTGLDLSLQEWKVSKDGG